MFIKPFKVKSNTMIKGTDRKKLRGQLLEHFKSLQEDDAHRIVPKKDEMSVMKIVAFGGEVMTVFCVGKNPLVIEFSGRMFPSVYLLWQYPELLFTYTTHPNVVSNLSNGADLMLPGVVTAGEYNLYSFGRLEKGEIVAVNTTENLCPVAVGLTARSSFDMYMSAKRGKCVEVMHVYGDFLWKHGTQTPPPNFGVPPHLVEELKETPTDGDNLSSGCEDHDNSEDSDTSDKPEDALENGVAGLAVAAETSEEKTHEFEEEEEVEKSSQESMDDLLKYCFLKAWNSSAKKLSLPILTGNFYTSHIKLVCPNSENVDIKKSTFKKLSKFLHFMETEGVVKISELKKGFDNIVAVDYSHPLIKQFQLKEGDTFELPQAEGSDEPIFKPPEFVELFNITAAVLPIFREFGYRKGDAIPAAKVREELTRYVRDHELQDESDKRFVKLDPILTDCLITDYRTTLRWEQLFKVCFQKMTSAYSMTSGSRYLVIKGKLEPVRISVESRSGNKKVTLVGGLETFNIDLRQFAHFCQVGVGASTTVMKEPNRKSGNQVLVQGNQVVFVGKLLQDQYKLPQRYIRGLDQAPKPPKKRR